MNEGVMMSYVFSVVLSHPTLNGMLRCLHFTMLVFTDNLMCPQESLTLFVQLIMTSSLFIYFLYLFWICSSVKD